MPRLLFLLCSLLLAACSQQADLHETRFMMGTLVRFTIADSDHAQAEAAVKAAADEMQRIDDLFTIYGHHPNPVKAFNALPPGHGMLLPDEIVQVLKLSLRVQQQSGGAFNPFLGGINQLWGFSDDHAPSTPPAAAAIAAALPPAHCIHRQGKQWFRDDARCLLDFGAIAKGYAVDRGIALLQQHGIRHALIDAGGDIRIIGSHHGKPWRIGIRHPRHKGEVLQALNLSGDVSIVTSGDYERFFVTNGVRYHHIIDPKNGWPARGVQSVSIIAPSTMLADAWSTALFVIGAQGIDHYPQWRHRLLLVDQQGIRHGDITPAAGSKQL